MDLCFFIDTTVLVDFHAATLKFGMTKIAQTLIFTCWSQEAWASLSCIPYIHTTGSPSKIRCWFALLVSLGIQSFLFQGVCASKREITTLIRDDNRILGLGNCLYKSKKPSMIINTVARNHI